MWQHHRDWQFFNHQTGADAAFGRNGWKEKDPALILGCVHLIVTRSGRMRPQSWEISDEIPLLKCKALGESISSCSPAKWSARLRYKNQTFNMFLLSSVQMTHPRAARGELWECNRLSAHQMGSVPLQDAGFWCVLPKIMKKTLENGAEAHITLAPVK